MTVRPSRSHGLPRAADGDPPRSAELGQAAVEWIALVFLTSTALAGLAALAPRVDGRTFGGFLAHRVVCAAVGGCRDGDRALARAYGARAAALVRRYAPGLVYEPGERQLPVDWRECRRTDCAAAPDRRGLDVHRSDAGMRATVFTHVLRRDGRTYIQYWLYYPDSNTTLAGSDRAWELAWLIPRLERIVRSTPRYPGYHRDDWEGYVVRLDRDGSAWARSSSHGHWQGCKEKDCENEWIPSTGWTRVSRGSHAGHVPVRIDLRQGDARLNPRDAQRRGARPGARHSGPPVVRHQTPLFPGVDLDERTTTAEGLRLIPLATRETRRYRPHAEGVRPPWRKEAYRHPESDRS